MTAQDPANPTPDLSADYASLLREVAELKAARRTLGQILVAISRGMQGSSASIKAAVSSLLNHDIFWDPANQYEFLQTIDKSVDNLAQFAFLLAVASRIEAESLDLRPEAYALQEIVMAARARTLARLPDLNLDTTLPDGGAAIRADFEYLTLALNLLLEVVVGAPTARQVRLEAHEDASGWQLNISQIDRTSSQLIQTYFAAAAEGVPAANALSAQSALKLFIVRDLLDRHAIGLEVHYDPAHDPEIRLRFGVTQGGR